MKIDNIMILFSVLLLIGLGIRADIETDLRARDNRIFILQQQVNIKVEQIQSLQDQLKPLPYSQPLNYIRVSSKTGIRTNPMGGGKERLHQGIDLIGKIGNPIYSVLAGRVVENWLSPGWHNGIRFNGHPVMGGYIVIDHGDQVFSLYGHLSRTIVREDQWVEAGEKIGELGNTGISTGAHLHFQIVTNPFKYLKERR